MEHWGDEEMNVNWIFIDQVLNKLDLPVWGIVEGLMPCALRKYVYSVVVTDFDDLLVNGSNASLCYRVGKADIIT